MFITKYDLSYVFSPSQLDVIATMLAMGMDDEPDKVQRKILAALNAAHTDLDGRTCTILSAEQIEEYSLV